MVDLPCWEQSPPGSNINKYSPGILFLKVLQTLSSGLFDFGVVWPTGTVEGHTLTLGLRNFIHSFWRVVRCTCVFGNQFP